MHVRIMCFDGDVLVSGEDGSTSVELPAPTVGSMTVADLPAHRFGYAWGLLASSVDHLTASPNCRVEAHRVVLAKGEECLVFVALVSGNEPADRHSERIFLWTAGELVQELPLRIMKPTADAS
jgi:hypothetical protein